MRICVNQRYNVCNGSVTLPIGLTDDVLEDNIVLL